MVGAAGSGVALAARLLAERGLAGCGPRGCGVGSEALRVAGRAWWCPPATNLLDTPVPHRGVCADPSAATVLAGQWPAAVVVVRHPVLAARQSSRDRGWELPNGLALWERTTRLLFAGLAGTQVLFVARQVLDTEPELFTAAVHALAYGEPGPELPVPPLWLPPVEPPRSALDAFTALRSALGRHAAFIPPALPPEPGWVEARLVAHAAAQNPPLPDPIPITTSVVSGSEPLPPWAERVETQDPLAARGGVIVGSVLAAPEEGVDRLGTLRRGVVADRGGRPVSVVVRGDGVLLAETCRRLLAGVGSQGEVLLADVPVAPFTDLRLVATGRGTAAAARTARHDIVVLTDVGVEPGPGWRAVIGRGVVELLTGVLASATATDDARSVWRAQPPHGLLAVRAEVLAAVEGLDPTLDGDQPGQQVALCRRVTDVGLKVVVDLELRTVLSSSTPVGTTASPGLLS